MSGIPTRSSCWCSEDEDTCPLCTISLRGRRVRKIYSESSPNSAPPSIAGVDGTPEFIPFHESIESGLSISSPFPNTEVEAEAGDSEQPIPIDAEVAPTPGFDLEMMIDSCINKKDTDDEAELIFNAMVDHNELVSQAWRLSEKTFPVIERKLKAKIQLRKNVNVALRINIQKIVECGKYHQKLKKLEEELQAERSETDMLVKRTAEAAQVDGLLEDGKRLEKEFLGA